MKFINWVVLISFLFLIVLSAFFIKYYNAKSNQDIKYIIHTTSSQDRLNVNILAELLSLSIDKPVNISCFNIEKAKKKLLKTNVFKNVEISKKNCDSIYIDYELRNPIAMISNFKNIAIDENGFFFKFYPFFSHKNIPEIVLDSNFCSKNIMDLAFSFLKNLNKFSKTEKFFVKKIDMSKMSSNSFATREILITVEDRVTLLKHILRFSPYSFENQINNYIILKKKYLSNERIVDFRIEGFAFIEN